MCTGAEDDLAGELLLARREVGADHRLPGLRAWGNEIGIPLWNRIDKICYQLKRGSRGAGEWGPVALPEVQNNRGGTESGGHESHRVCSICEYVHRNTEHPGGCAQQVTRNATEAWQGGQGWHSGYMYLGSNRCSWANPEDQRKARRAKSLGGTLIVSKARWMRMSVTKITEKGGFWEYD
jgi:hypothetical protein